MTKLEYEEIDILSGATGTNNTQYGTFQNVKLLQLVIDPNSTTTSTIPSAAWDITVKESTTDVPVYANTSLSSTVTAVVNFSSTVPLRYPISVDVANMGATKQATVRVYYERL